MHRSRLCAALLLGALLSACANTTAPRAGADATATLPAPSPAVTATAEPAVWVFPPGSRIAGVDISGLTPARAIKMVSLGIAPLQRPIPLTTDPASVDDTTPTIMPYRVGLAFDVRAAVEQAAQRARAGQPVAIDWTPQVDQARLRQELEALAPQFAQLPASDVLTDERAITTTFTFRARPGIQLDVERTAALLTPLLLDATRQYTQTVVLQETPVRRGPLAELERVLRAHVAYWDGVAGIYVHDLESGETLGINQDTVFSGASVMKVPIMIFTYAQLGALDEQQRAWMEGMILESDNLDANALLAAAVGGQGTEAALEGVNQMNEMLAALGLQHTYQLIPYESGEWLIQQSKLPQGGPPREGAPPYTAPDPYVRTTPREMGQLFVMLEQCAQGHGPLLERVGQRLTRELCREMIDWLIVPHDPERMLAGIPDDVPVAHKGGWIDDMQSDVGIVYSPGGRYVAAIYVWREGYVTDVFASPSPYLGDFSHTIYTFFNPEPLPE